MRSKFSAGVLVAAALLIPAAPALAQTEQPGLNAACQTVERKVFKDVRKMLAVDLDTANAVQVQILATRILAEAQANSVPVLGDAVEKKMGGTTDDLRTFLKTGAEKAWSVGLRVVVNQSMSAGGTNVQAAAQKVLDGESVDDYLAFLNEDLYAARKLDCASQPSSSPSVTPGASPSASASASSTPSSIPSAGPSVTGGAGGGDAEDEDGGLPVTGAGTGTVAGIGGALLLLGGAGYLVGRRRRSRFVA